MGSSSAVPAFFPRWLFLVLFVSAALLTAAVGLGDVGGTAPDPAVELSAAIAAREAHPPDLAAARMHLLNAAGASDDRTSADALCLLGELDELEMDFARAVTDYQASATRLPSGRYTPRANRRANELRTHAEGDFEPLKRLETVRRSALLSNDPVAIDALVRDAASFPPGRVRVEAGVLAAEAYAGRLHRPDDSLPLLRLALEDPHAEVLIARAAASELLQALIARKDFASALALTDTFPKLLPSSARRDLLRVMRRRPIRAASWALLTVLSLFALRALARSKHRARAFHAVKDLAPMALVFAGVASGLGGVLASRYEQTNPYPFAAMLPAMFVIALLARAWSATGAPSPSARAVRGIVAFLGVFAAAFLLLDRMDPVYLSGFGL